MIALTVAPSPAPRSPVVVPLAPHRVPLIPRDESSSLTEAVDLLLEAARLWHRPGPPGGGFPPLVWRRVGAAGLAWLLPRLDTLLCVVAVHGLESLDLGPLGSGRSTPDAVLLARVLGALLSSGRLHTEDGALARLAQRLDARGAQVLRRVLTSPPPAAMPPRAQRLVMPQDQSNRQNPQEHPAGEDPARSRRPRLCPSFTQDTPVALAAE